MKHSAELRDRVGLPEQTITIVLQKGDTFWQLCDAKYGGIHPIAAIYWVNNLLPTYENRDGKQVLIDPLYYADAAYILPSATEIATLSAQFWQEFDPRSVPERIGKANQRTNVCLRWDETFHDLAKAKYNGRDASKAIFEANQMSPKMTVQDNCMQVQEPIYQAGCSYIFPAEEEIAELEKQYDTRVQLIKSQAGESADK